MSKFKEFWKGGFKKTSEQEVKAFIERMKRYHGSIVTKEDIMNDLNDEYIDVSPQKKREYLERYY